jgi:response regulator RpfG family c-di-GMP phosphodiesterase
VSATVEWEVPVEAASPTIGARLDHVTIVVVDDQSDAREMLATLLEQQGATVSRVNQQNRH